MVNRRRTPVPQVVGYNRGTRREQTTVGFDPNLQNVGSDPYGSPYWVGQTIQPTPPANGSRYLYLLALSRFGAHRKARLVGMRQLVTIGQYIPFTVSTTAAGGQTLPTSPVNVASTAGFPSAGIALITTSAGVQKVMYTGLTPTSLTGVTGGVGVIAPGALVQAIIANYPLEREVTTPFWKFVDGNISWHLRRIGPLYQNTTATTKNSESMQFLYGQTPALLFQNLPSDFGGYVPPYGGQPPGNALIPDLATFHDIRFPWWSNQAWHGLDIEIEGPCDIALFASVLQTNPLTRTPLVIPPGVPLRTLQPEDAFIATPANPADPRQQIGPAPNAVYARVAGSLIFEEPNMISTPLQLMESVMEESALCRSNDGGRGDGNIDYTIGEGGERCPPKAANGGSKRGSR